MSVEAEAKQILTSMLAMIRDHRLSAGVKPRRDEIEVSGGKVTLHEYANAAAVLMVADDGSRTAITLTPAARAALKAAL